jgi:deoxyribonuclease-4
MLGYHISLPKHLSSIIDEVKTNKLNVFQIYLSSPKRYESKRRTNDELQLFQKQLKSCDVKCFIHGNLMINFCNPSDSKIYKLSKKSLIHDLIESTIIGAEGVVIHMGKNVKTLKLSVNEAIQNYMKGIEECLNQTQDSIIILETGAGQGTEICTEIKQLGQLYRSFQVKHRKRLRFCIDTCHIFASGNNLSDIKFVEEFDKTIEKELGWDNVTLIHLNDSKKPCNSHIDRHSDLTKGCIHSNGLSTFVKLCCNRHIPIVLETPQDTLSYMEQLNIVKKWIHF